MEETGRSTLASGAEKGALSAAASREWPVTFGPELVDNFFAKIPRIFLHLRRISVISQLRTNFAECPGKRSHPGAARESAHQERDFKGDAVVRVSRPEEEAIGIGNCNRSSQHSIV
jgi:hypothetical protein